MTRLRPARLAARAAIVFFALALVPNAFADTSVTPTSVGVGTYIAGTTPGTGPQWRFAGLIGVSLDGQSTWTYCIDVNNPLRLGVPHEEAAWSDSSIPNLANVTRILDRYPADATAARRDALEAAAVQAAIWHFTDGFDLVWAPTRVRELYDAIVRDAALNPVSEPAATLSLSPSSQAAPAGSVLAVTVATDGPGPVTLSLAPADGARLVDCDTGAAVASTLAGPFPKRVCVVRDSAGAPVTLSASTTARVPAGRVFLRSGSQQLILAAGRTVSASAAATVTWTDVPAPASPPSMTTTLGAPPSPTITVTTSTTAPPLESGPDTTVSPDHGYRAAPAKAVLGAKASKKPRKGAKPRKGRGPIKIPFTR